MTHAPASRLDWEPRLSPANRKTWRGQRLCPERTRGPAGGRVPLPSAAQHSDQALILPGSQLKSFHSLIQNMSTDVGREMHSLMAPAHDPSGRSTPSSWLWLLTSARSSPHQSTPVHTGPLAACPALCPQTAEGVAHLCDSVHVLADALRHTQTGADTPGGRPPEQVRQSLSHAGGPCCSTMSPRSQTELRCPC